MWRISLEAVELEAEGKRRKLCSDWNKTVAVGKWTKLPISEDLKGWNQRNYAKFLS